MVLCPRKPESHYASHGPLRAPSPDLPPSLASGHFPTFQSFQNRKPRLEDKQTTTQQKARFAKNKNKINKNKKQKNQNKSILPTYMHPAAQHLFPKALPLQLSVKGDITWGLSRRDLALGTVQCHQVNAAQRRGICSTGPFSTIWELLSSSRNGRKCGTQ